MGTKNINENSLVINAQMANSTWVLQYFWDSICIDCNAAIGATASVHPAMMFRFVPLEALYEAYPRYPIDIPYGFRYGTANARCHSTERHGCSLCTDTFESGHIQAVAGRCQSLGEIDRSGQDFRQR